MLLSHFLITGFGSENVCVVHMDSRLYLNRELGLQVKPVPMSNDEAGIYLRQFFDRLDSLEN